MPKAWKIVANLSFGVIRPPISFNLKGEFRAEWLPNGFEERMVERKKGMLVQSWAPQLEILSQIDRGISQPRQMEFSYKELKPGCADHREEMGVCIELTKTGVENSIVREEVKRVIDLVDKNGKKGQEMKKKAVEIGELIKAAVRKEEGRRGLLFKQWMILFLPFSQLLRLEGNHFVWGGAWIKFRNTESITKKK
ncbi:unnamed protein product [Camellia sinensis]